MPCSSFVLFQVANHMLMAYGTVYGIWCLLMVAFQGVSFSVQELLIYSKRIGLVDLSAHRNPIRPTLGDELATFLLRLEMVRLNL